jgi:hypothetical protein
LSNQKGFISDAEMNKIESDPGFISDEDMNALESDPGFISDKDMAELEESPDFISDSEMETFDSDSGSNLLMTKPVRESDLDDIATRYKVDKEDIRDAIGWKGGHDEKGWTFTGEGDTRNIFEEVIEGGKRGIGGLGEAFTFGLPAFLKKKMQDDPNLRMAIDEAYDIVKENQSLAGLGTELMAGVGSAAGLSKLAGKASKIYEPITAGTSGAFAGLFNSDEGQEAESVLFGSLVGLGLYSGLAGIGKGLAWKAGRKEKKLTDTQENEIQKTLRESRDKFEAEKNSGVHETFRMGVTNKETMKNTLDSGERNRAIRFMKFTNTKISDLSEDLIDVSNNQIKNAKTSKRKQKALLSAYGESVRAGKVTDEMIDAFLLRENIIENVAARNFDELKRLDQIDPDDRLASKIQESRLKNTTEGSINQGEAWGLRATQLFRIIDDKMGTDLEPLINKVYTANAKKSGFEREVLDEYGTAITLQQKQKMSMEDVYDQIENKDSTGPVVDAWRDVFKTLRELSIDNGLDVKDLGKTYVPKRKKNGARLIRALEAKSDKLEQDPADLIAFLEKREKSILPKKRTNQLGKWTKDLKESEVDLLFFVNELERVSKMPIQNLASVQKAASELRSPRVISGMGEFQVGALHKRGELHPPKWLLERNVNRLLRQSIREATDQLFIDPVARQLSARAGILETFGDKTAAESVREYIDGLTGRGNGRKIANNRIRNIKRELDLLDDGKESGKLVEYIADQNIKFFYASVMGARIDNLVRNLTQTITKTVPEFGWTRGTKYLLQSYRDMAKNIKKGGWKEMVSEAEDVYNLKTRQNRASDFAGLKEDLYKEIRGPRTQQIEKAVNAYSEFVMKPYMKTDEVNRVATIHMSKSFVNDLLKASPDDMTQLKKVISKWPKTLQRELDIAMRDPSIEEEDLVQLIAGHLVPETQVMYGPIGQSKLLRHVGKIMSTLSDYPHHMLSDAYYKLAHEQSKGLHKLIYNYAPAMILFMGLDQTLDLTDPAVEFIIGKGGFQGMHPINTAGSTGDILGIPHLENLGKLGMELANPKHENSRRRAIKNFIQIYGHGPGMVWKHSENILDAFDEKKKGKWD